MTPTADPAERPLDRILFSSSLVEIGKFRVRAEDPRFEDSGPIERHIVVFPRNPVWIRHEGRKPFLAAPDLVTCYNRGQVYRRRSVRRMPDRCEWFAFPEAVLSSALAERDPSVAERPGRPFRFQRGPSDPGSYLTQRRLVEMLSAGGPAEADAMEVEETALELLRRLLPVACDAAGIGNPIRQFHSMRTRADRDLAENAKAELSRSLGAPAKLADVAERLEVSPFHLCRAFRRATGSTVHRYRNGLRLAASLEMLRETRRGVTDVALALGFSSHSHFTAAFRREYGVTPRAFRPGFRRLSVSRSTR
jgi:AraC-like DNA-binding protein